MPRTSSGRPSGRQRMPFESYLKEDVQTGCIEWIGHRVRGGYGQVNKDGKDAYAHRVAYERQHGEIPDGLRVLHRCDNPPCCNPDHLFLGTHADNMRDKAAKGRSASMPGETNPSAKLTADDVRTIRRLCADGAIKKEVGSKFGVTGAAVRLIVLRKKWAHID